MQGIRKKLSPFLDPELLDMIILGLLSYFRNDPGALRARFPDPIQIPRDVSYLVTSRDVDDQSGRTEAKAPYVWDRLGPHVISPVIQLSGDSTVHGDSSRNSGGSNQISPSSNVILSSEFSVTSEESRGQRS